jgi:hypothetical protein
VLEETRQLYSPLPPLRAIDEVQLDTNGVAVEFRVQEAHSCMRQVANVVRWLNENVGAIQAISSLAVAILTVFLVSFTRRYVKRTGEALEITRDQLRLLEHQVKEEARALALSREQFEQEWKPDLRIAFMGHSRETQAFAKVANLAKPSALVTGIRVIAEGGEQCDMAVYPQSELILGGMAVEIPVQRELIRYRQTKSCSTAIRQEAKMKISFTYYCAGRTLETDWYSCSASFCDEFSENLPPMLREAENIADRDTCAHSGDNRSA